MGRAPPKLPPKPPQAGQGPLPSNPNTPAVVRVEEVPGYRQKPAPGTPPAQPGNALGVIVPKTSPQPPGRGAPQVRPETPEERAFLERAAAAYEALNIEPLERAKEGMQGAIDHWVERQGYAQWAMIAGALGKAGLELFMPTNALDLVPGGKLVGLGGKAVKQVAKRADDGAPKPPGGGGGNKPPGGRVDGKKRRKPKHRCELVPYAELECEPGQHRHHVVPDFVLRLGRRGSSERIPGMPSLDDGPAICLDAIPGKDQHHKAHKYGDPKIEKAGRSARGGRPPGTITLGEAKLISAESIEKATGGKNKGGCSKEDIKKQLDEHFKAHNDTLLRALKDARNVTEDLKSVIRGTPID